MSFKGIVFFVVLVKLLVWVWNGFLEEAYNKEGLLLF